MILTWTTLHTRRPVPSAPWQPDGAQWWQAGHSGSGRLEAPMPDGQWWSVLATWPSRDLAEVGPRPCAEVEAWHVVLEATSFHGVAALADGARPFDALEETSAPEGPAAVVTFAGTSADDAREREFFRRFMHLGRSIRQAPGQLAALVQVPADGAAVLTFSAWADLGRALDWAYAQPLHSAAVARQRSHHLVETSGSLRCRVLSSSGTLGDLGDPLAGARTCLPVTGGV